MGSDLARNPGTGSPRSQGAGCSGALAFLFIASGAFVLVANRDPSTHVVGLVMLIMGVGFAVIAAAQATSASTLHAYPTESLVLRDGQVVAALVLPASRRVQRAWTIFLGLVGLGSFVLALDPAATASFGEVAPSLLLGSLGVMSLAGLVINLRAWSDQPLVALTPGGLLDRGPGADLFIAWDSIRDVGVGRFTGFGPPSVFVDAEAVRRTGAPWLLSRPLVRHDVTLPAGLSVPPDVLLALIRHYLEAPSERRSLGRDRRLLDQIAREYHDRMEYGRSTE